MRIVETTHTFLTAVEVDALVGDYLAGMSVKSLAEACGIHRATVFSHLRRCNVPSCRPGLVWTRMRKWGDWPERASRCGRSLV